MVRRFAFEHQRIRGRPHGGRCFAEPLERRLLLADAVSSFPIGLFEANGLVYFSGLGAGVGRELMVTDGTDAGTRLVKDINPSGDSNPVPVGRLGDTSFFSADDGTHGRELWKSDGTEAGTVMVKDAEPGPQSGAGMGAGVLGGALYFSGPGGVWRTDGTDAGTTIVADGGSPLAVAGPYVYFRRSDASTGMELWKTDGITDSPVIDLRPGPATPTFGIAFIGVGNYLYFTAVAGPDGVSNLYRTDGTSAGTVLLKSHVSMVFDQPARRTGPLANTVFFVTGDAPTGGIYDTATETDLWKTDGTVAGTVKVKDFVTDAFQTPTHVLAGYSGGVLIQSNAGLWKSDGTEGGTVQIGGSTGFNLYAGEANGTIYFSGSESQTGVELWKSDGTPGGARLVKDVLPGFTSTFPSGPNSSTPRLFQATRSGNVVFVAYSTPYGMGPMQENLYTSDGTADGTRLLLPHIGPEAATVVGRRVFYNNSAFDHSRDGADDDAAIATDKQALLPGDAASFANVTSYSKGLNGVMIDVRGLPAGNLSVDDFVIRTGPGPTPAGLGDGPPNFSVTIRRGAGVDGSDRVTLVWSDYDPSVQSFAPQAAANEWLEVEVKANGHTGLALPDVFYFGNLIGEVGNDAGSLIVNAVDLGQVRANQLTPNPSITSRYDFNRDRAVNALDLAKVRANTLRSLAPMQAPPPPGASAALQAGSATNLLRET